jgi:hypothetical protein
MMSAENYQYIAAHLTESERGFFDVVNLLLEAGHRENEDQALQQADIATMRMSPTDSEAQAYFRGVQDRARQIISGSGSWLEWTRDANNQNDGERG